MAEKVSGRWDSFMQEKMQNSEKISVTEKIARIYLRVSTQEQDLARQEDLVSNAKQQGYYVAAVYREKASGASADRHELKRMIGDLQKGEVVIAESIDRISRLPLPDAEALVTAIQNRGAVISVPGLIDLTEIAASAEGVSRIVLDAIQQMLLKIALQQSRDDYEQRRARQKQGIALAQKKNKYKGRAPDQALHQRVISLRNAGHSYSEVARLSGCSISTAKRVCSGVKNNTH